jgi:hypothetical protein
MKHFNQFLFSKLSTLFAVSFLLAFTLSAREAYSQSVSGPTDLCPNTTYTYSVTGIPSNAYDITYAWFPGWSGTIVSGVWSSSAQALFYSGNYTSFVQCLVEFETPDDGSDTDEDPQSFSMWIDLDVNVNGVDYISNISGPTSLPYCTSVTETYSVDPVDNATYYTWTLPSGWSGSSGSNTITITTVDPSSAGTISVKAHGCGSEVTQTKTLNVTRSGPPAPTFKGKNPDCICLFNMTHAEYCVAIVPNATFYQWDIPSAWTIVNTSSTDPNCVVINFNGVALNNGQIKCRVWASCAGGAPVPGAWANFNVSTFNNTPAPPNPVITVTPTINEQKWAVAVYMPAPPRCVTSEWWASFYENESYFLNSEHGNGPGLFYRVMHNGQIFTYTIKWTGPCGDTRSTQAGYKMDHGELVYWDGWRQGETGLADVPSEINLYPNPASNQLSIVSSGIASDDARLQVSSIDGKVILDQHVKLTGDRDNVELNIRSLPNGIYNLSIVKGETLMNKRFVVQRQ